MDDKPRTVIYLEPSGPVLKEITASYAPTGSESLVRVEFSGINPADTKHRLHRTGLHSSVCGYDFSGEVLSTGPDSPFQSGDKIYGMNQPGPHRPLSRGAHQDYTISEAQFFHKVPLDRISTAEASTIAVATRTAADGVFNNLNLAFSAAGIRGAGQQSVLIWGGASAVGVAALQLIKAAGHGPVFVTASPRNHALLITLGADFCFDYRDEDVVGKIRRAVASTGKPLKHVFDTVGVGVTHVVETTVGFDETSPAMAARCVDDGDDAKFVCALRVSWDRRWGLSIATRTPGYPFAFETPKELEEEWHENMRKATRWVNNNYGEGKFKVPNVRIVRGKKAALEALAMSAAGKVSLEKLTIAHPL
ncbi:hypothetical protein F4779DRAFT_611471 [Xylariaceae sp. FL0662B]|nr:hypothetical protein F4779DRAFT_611471 [Xylariaceae sp. FL0662B]